MSLSPVKYYGNISYYGYDEIKGSIQHIALRSKNSSAIINFATAQDFRNSIISFNVKSKNGTEKLAMVLRDTNKMSNANKDDIILTPALPNNTWQSFNINLKNLNLPVNKARIEQIRFDSSDNLTGNNNDSEIYIKNIVVE